MGRTHGWMYADDDAISPDLIRATWHLWEGPVKPDPASAVGRGVTAVAAPRAAREGSWRAAELVRVQLGGAPSMPWCECMHAVT